MFRIFCAVALFSICQLCQAEELTIRQLIAGVNQARQQIRSGEMRIIVKFDYEAKKSPEEIQTWIQQREADILKEYSMPNQREIREEELQDLRFEAKWYEKRQVVEESNVAFQIFDPSSPHYPRIFQYKMNRIDRLQVDLFSEEAKYTTAGTYRILTYDGTTQAYEALNEFPVHSVDFSNYSKYRSFLYFELYGRSAYRVPPNATLVGKETIKGLDCYVLKFRPEDESYALSPEKIVKIWVVPKKAFCIRKQEVYDGNHLMAAWTMIYEDFQEYAEIWFPVVSTWTHRWSDGSLDRINTFVVKEAEFNLDFPPDFFQINPKSYTKTFLKQPPTPNESVTSDESQPEVDPLLLTCGPNSLLRVCELLRVNTDFDELTHLSRFDPRKGTTLLGLRDAAKYKGLNPKGIKTNLKSLKKNKLPMPAIAYVKGNHFLVFEEVVSDGVLISDSADKYDRYLTFKELSEIWNGEMLIFDYQPEQIKQEPIPLALAEAGFYDFGEALGGDEVRHTFKLKNIGQKPLKITKVDESCACTATLISKDEIPPGAFGIIETVLKVPSENRQVEESINVYTNDPNQNRVTFVLKGTAFVPITTFPPRVLIGSIHSKTLVTKSLTIHRKGNTQILGVRTDSSHLLTSVDSAKDDPIIRVKITLLESTPVGRFVQNLLVDYQYEGKRTTHKVMVFGEILGAFTVSPNQFFFGLVKEKQSVSKTVAISSVDKRPFKIVSVESKLAYVTTKITPRSDGIGYQLTTTVQSEAPAGPLSNEILVNTDNAAQPTIQIPFSGIISN